MSDLLSLKPATPPGAGVFGSAVRVLLLLLLFAAALFIGMAYAPVPQAAASRLSLAGVPGFAAKTEAPPLPAPPQPVAETLTLRMRAALDYTSRRYRVSPEALVPVFAAVQLAARELDLDPLLIVAVIGIESSFNPFSESTMGAQGLMQVIPRFHQDKLPGDAGKLHLFDPIANVRVGARALHEYIRRSGDVIAGLQQFAGSRDDPEQGYAAKVLAEKERLEFAARREANNRLPESR